MTNSFISMANSFGSRPFPTVTGSAGTHAIMPNDTIISMGVQQKSFIDDVGRLLDTDEGRRTISYLLDICGVFAGGFVPADEAMHRNGMRTVGLVIYDAVRQAPDGIAKLEHGRALLRSAIDSEMTRIKTQEGNQ